MIRSFFSTVDALSDILFYTSCSEEEFLIEIMRQDAVAHIARFRDVLSHHYFGVDQKTVWSIAKKDAKEAHLAISQLEEYVKALDDFKRKQQEKVEDLRKKKDEIYEIARNHKALKLYLFGSCSRQNDLNFVAEFKDASLSDLGALTDDLEQFLERKIAVFPLTSLKDYSFGDRISKEMVLL